MFVLQDIGLAILICVFFIFFHFLFERGILLKRIAALNITRWNLELIAGVYYALISVGIDAVVWQIIGNFSIHTAILTSVAIITLRTPVAATINLLPSLVFHVLLAPITNLTYVMYGILFFGMLLYIVSKEFSSSRLFPKVMLMGSVVIAALAIFLAFYIIGGYALEDLLTSTIVLAISAFIMLLVISYYVNFSQSANVLLESVTYTYLDYYRQANGLAIIENLIHTDKIKNGLFIVFAPEVENEQLKPESKKEILAAFFDNLAKQLPTNVTKLAVEGNTYALFWPNKFSGSLATALQGNDLYERESSDPLKDVEQIFANSQKEYETELGEKAKVRAKVGVAVYGVQEDSLEKLEDDALFAFNAFNSQSKNPVALFNYVKMQSVLEDSRKLAALDQTLKLDNFTLTHEGIYSVKDHKWIGMLTGVMSNSELNLVYSVREHVKFNHWETEFDRYFAINALQEFVKSDFSLVMFNYAPLTASEDLDIDEIKSKVEQMNVKPRQVVFVIDEKPIYKWQMANIERAQALGFSIALVDIYDVKVLNQVKPNWLIVTPSNFAKVNAKWIDKTIFSGLESPNLFEQAKRRGARYYAGPILAEGKYFKNLENYSKPSKM